MEFVCVFADPFYICKIFLWVYKSFFVFVEGVYIYRLHIYTQIVDLFTQIIMKQIYLHNLHSDSI